MHSFTKYLYNLWNGYSEKKERQYEARLLYKWAKISEKDVNISNIKISDIKDDTIHCISISSGNKLPLVMIPGFGSSGGMYYKIIKQLAEKYDLYLIDMRGMGW